MTKSGVYAERPRPLGFDSDSLGLMSQHDLVSGAGAAGSLLQHDEDCSAAMG